MAEQLVENSDVQQWLAQVKREKQFLEKLRGLKRISNTVSTSLFEKVAARGAVSSKDLKEAAAEAGVESDDVEKYLMSISYLYGGLPPVLTPDSAIQVLASQALLSNEQAANVSMIVTSVDKPAVLKAAKKVRQKLEASDLTSAALPQLNGAWVRIVTVAKFDEEPEVDDDLAKYMPRIESQLPLVVLQMEIDSYGSTSQVAVGLTQSQAQTMSRRLAIAIKQLEAFE